MALPTEIWQAKFLAALRVMPVVTRACTAANVPQATVYQCRQRDKAFAEAMDEAIEEGIDNLEAEAMRRAAMGYEELVIYQGQPTPVWERDAAGKVVLDDEGNAVQARNPDGSLKYLTVQKFSDGLLQFVLKGRRRKVYGDKQEITGKDGEPLVPADESSRAARVAALMALAERRKAAGGEDLSDLA